jgi:hypothetical protein
MEKFITRQPVIAERTLVARGTDDHLTLRIHQPELGGTVAEWPWRCGFVLEGLPSIPKYYGPDAALAQGEAWFVDGQDSFDALMVALIYVRGMIDCAEKEFGVRYVWEARADWGHMIPRWITLTYGRQFEERLLDVMGDEETRLLKARTPNPYAWDDPRHPSQWARQHRRDRPLDRLE